MASIIKSKEFPLLKSKELKFYPEDVSSLFTKYFNGDDLTKKINKCLNADDYKQMKMMRDVLSHRGTPPRNFYSGGERNGMVTMPINIKAPSNQWQYNFLVDEKTTTKFSEWLSGTLKELVESSVYFCTQQLS